MDINSILNMLNKANINSNEVQNLIHEASRLNLSDDDNIRLLIRKSAKLANREISLDKEDKIISILKEKGISSELFNFLK